MPNQNTPYSKNGQQPGERPVPPPRRAAAAYSQSSRPPQQRQGTPPRGTADGRTPPPGQPRRQQPPSRGEGSRWIRAILMVLATIGLCVFLAFSILDTANDLFGLNQVDQIYEIDIPKGATNKDVANILRESGVINNGWVFRVYADMKTKDKSFQPGSYLFNSNEGYDEIIVKLRSGDFEKNEVRLTFAEGRTMAEIAKILEEYKVCEAQEFLGYLDEAEYDYEFFNALPNEPLRFRKLEGYIFPDTYDFYEGENVADVARKFVRNFNTKIDDELKERMLEMNLSIDETITLASIIQREAATEEDMKKVSSVFHNRLAVSETYPNLQSDVTIFYVNNNIKPYLETTNQPMYDAYNTYVRRGLPAGPICNPGMDAIMAALYPADTDDYFFVTDANEEFYYAQTLEEHNRNVSLARSVGGEAHGINTMDDQ